MTDVPSLHSQAGEALYYESTRDAVFGDITEDSPNYRNVCSLREASARVLWIGASLAGFPCPTALTTLHR